MTLTRFYFTERARPVMEVGLGSTVMFQGAGIWDVSLWDAPDALWNGDEPLWRDVSCDVIDAHIELGRGRISDSFPVGIAEISVDNDSGWADPATQDFAGVPTPGTVDFPGVNGNYMSTTGLGITGPITIVMRWAADSWSPGGVQAAVGEWLTTGSKRGWQLRLNGAGAMRWIWSTDGSSNTVVDSSALGYTNGARNWSALTFVTNDGAGNRQVRFWNSTDGESFTLLSTPGPTAGTTSIFDPTTFAGLSISGTDNGASNPFAGLIDYISIRSGTGASGTVGGTEVFRWDADVDLVGVHPAATTVESSSGHTMTVHRSGSPGVVLVAPGEQLDLAQLKLRPGRALRIGVAHSLFGAKWLYYGFIDEIVATHSPTDWSKVTLRCIDALGEGGRAKLTADTATGDGEQARARFARILDAITWPSSKRAVSAAAIRKLYAAELDGQVVDLLRQTADSEGGWCYGDVNGRIVLQGRDWLYHETNTEVDATIGNIGHSSGEVLFLEDPPGSDLMVYTGDPDDWVEDPAGSGLLEWVGV